MAMEVSVQTLGHVLKRFVVGDNETKRVCREFAFTTRHAVNTPESFRLLRPLFGALPWASDSAIRSGYPFSPRSKFSSAKQQEWPSDSLRIAFCQFTLDMIDQDKVVFDGEAFIFTKDVNALKWFAKTYPELLKETKVKI